MRAVELLRSQAQDVAKRLEACERREQELSVREHEIEQRAK